MSNVTFFLHCHFQVDFQQITKHQFQYAKNGPLPLNTQKLSITTTLCINILNITFASNVWIKSLPQYFVLFSQARMIPYITLWRHVQCKVVENRAGEDWTQYKHVVHQDRVKTKDRLREWLSIASYDWLVGGRCRRVMQCCRRLPGHQMRLQRTAVLQCCRFTVTRLSSVLTRSEGSSCSQSCHVVHMLGPRHRDHDEDNKYTNTNDTESL